MKLLKNQEVAARATAAPVSPSSAANRAPAGESADTAPAAGRSLRWRLMVGVAIFVLAVVGLRWAMTSPGFAIRRVVVEGCAHANAEAIADSAGALGVNAFRVNLESVRRAVLVDPWIAEVRVRRVLPHELRVSVVEREPVALRDLAGELSLVDAQGRVIEEGITAGKFPLPTIVGLEKLAPEVRSARMARAAAALGAIRAASPRLFRVTRAIDASSAERLTLLSDSLPPIWIAGAESADEAAGYACRVDTVRRAIGDLEYVDARWSDRLFVMPTTQDRLSHRPGAARS